MVKIAYIAPQIGSLSTTFVYRDIAGLRHHGAEVAVFSVHRPKDSVVSEEARAYIAETDYLYDSGAAAFLLAALKRLFKSPIRFVYGLSLAIRDMALARVSRPSDRPKLLWHFIMGCSLAERVERAGARHIHANFAHVPTSIAMYAGAVSGIPYSFLCHAHDIFVNGSALKEKVARSAFATGSSNFNVRFLTDRGCDPGKLWVFRTGVDFDEFPLRSPKPYETPPRILSVAGLREKKGHRYLIDACRLLADRKAAFHCIIVGGGPLHEALQSQIRDSNLDGIVELAGPQPQERVKEYFQEADLFCLPCIEARNKDMDGTPLVIIESMSMGVPVVTTNVSGIPELVIDGETGLIVEPNDALGLANALEKLLQDESLAAKLRIPARDAVVSEFSQSMNIANLIHHIERPAPCQEIG